MTAAEAVRAFRHLIAPAIGALGLRNDWEGYYGAGIRGIGAAIRLYQPQRGDLARFVSWKIAYAIRDEERSRRQMKRRRRVGELGRRLIGGKEGLREMAALAAGGAEVSAGLEREEFWQAVESAAGDAVDRRIVRLLFRQGMGVCEAARVMGRSPAFICARRGAILRRLSPVLREWMTR